ncbi:MAG: hypothetical protein ACFB20_08585 [Opitutales bacterium]
MSEFVDRAIAKSSFAARVDRIRAAAGGLSDAEIDSRVQAAIDWARANPTGFQCRCQRADFIEYIAACTDIGSKVGKYYETAIHPFQYEDLVWVLLCPQLERLIPCVAALGRLSDLKLLARRVHPVDLSSLTLDTDDNWLLASALVSKADADLVTGDKAHLLPLEAVQGVAILEPATFLEPLQT